mmetsp:Transcript_71726/g.158467  ORF Transcript_71726/g.158467 Transcript_71726/m.158467 type:complete len:232 (+) Transcript_71726:742-1437(+)
MSMHEHHLELQNQWAAHQPAELRSKGKETQEQDCHEAGQAHLQNHMVCSAAPHIVQAPTQHDQQVTRDEDRGHRSPVPDPLHQKLRRGRAHLVPRSTWSCPFFEATEGGADLLRNLSIWRQAHEIPQAQGEHRQEEADWKHVKLGQHQGIWGSAGHRDGVAQAHPPVRAEEARARTAHEKRAQGKIRKKLFVFWSSKIIDARPQQKVWAVWTIRGGGKFDVLTVAEVGQLQ